MTSSYYFIPLVIFLGDKVKKKQTKGPILKFVSDLVCLNTSTYPHGYR